MRGRRFFTWGKFFVFVMLASIFVLAWSIIFAPKDCDSWECFSESLENCDRAFYVGGNKMIFEYQILGENDGACVVNVELLQGELNNRDSILLENQEMRCTMPLGLVAIPGSDINRCTGKLKEGLQGLVIQKLHTYIVQNLGKINLDVLEVPN